MSLTVAVTGKSFGPVSVSGVVDCTDGLLPVQVALPPSRMMTV